MSAQWNRARCCYRALGGSTLSVTGCAVTRLHSLRMKCPSTVLACSIMKAACQSVKTPAFVAALDLVAALQLQQATLSPSSWVSLIACITHIEMHRLSVDQGFFISKKISVFHKLSTHEGICIWTFLKHTMKKLRVPGSTYMLFAACGVRHRLCKPTSQESQPLCQHVWPGN